jgi:hypothetical protein
MTPTNGPRISYATAAAMRAGLRDRFAAMVSAGTGHRLDQLQRQFAYDRLLARVFNGPDAERWVLKGAGALLAPLPEARHSLDLDLAYTFTPATAADSTADAILAEAVSALHTAADRDLGDHFRFEITRTSALQEQARGRRLDLVVYLGARYAAFHVDVVVGTAMTGVPDSSPPLTPLKIEGLVRPSYRLFPLADHIADKLCAIIEVHDRGGQAQPSTRVKDLVDLALIATTQQIDGAALQRAVALGAAHRGLAPPDTLRRPRRRPLATRIPHQSAGGARRRPVVRRRCHPRRPAPRPHPGRRRGEPVDP